jgi:hypothetical protein
VKKRGELEVEAVCRLTAQAIKFLSVCRFGVPLGAELELVEQVIFFFSLNFDISTLACVEKLAWLWWAELARTRAEGGPNNQCGRYVGLVTQPPWYGLRPGLLKD